MRKWGHSTTFECPECGKPCAVYDRTGRRRWRHLDTMQFWTIRHAQPPRVK
ncbi:transposase family protein [Crateriforma conspicua]|uniref:transposase family protein n=1 Tax=Crateriforma conspicua TaxID=2527996 RepID=UPI0011A009B9